jgi:hypothetical protein
MHHRIAPASSFVCCIYRYLDFATGSASWAIFLHRLANESGEYSEPKRDSRCPSSGILRALIVFPVTFFGSVPNSVA